MTDEPRLLCPAHLCGVRPLHPAALVGNLHFLFRFGRFPYVGGESLLVLPCTVTLAPFESHPITNERRKSKFEERFFVRHSGLK
jgi:hypothetical protein